MNHPSFPFLTREMLSFGRKSQISFEITTFATFSSLISIRGVSKDSPFVVKHTTLGNRLAQTESFQIPDIPIFLSVEDDDNTFRSGECYVKLSLKINNDVVAQLAAGYVHQQKSLSWPMVRQDEGGPNAGKLSTIVVDDPAANNEWTVQPPFNTTWLIKSIRFT